MGEKLFESVMVIATAVIGVAIIAVILSKNAQTPAVLDAAGRAFGGILGVAVSPITGQGGGGYGVSAGSGGGYGLGSGGSSNLFGGQNILSGFPQIDPFSALSAASFLA